MDNSIIEQDLIYVSYLFNGETLPLSFYGRVLENTDAFIKVDTSSRCYSSIMELKWKQISDIRKAEYFELEEH